MSDISFDFDQVSLDPDANELERSREEQVAPIFNLPLSVVDYRIIPLLGSPHRDEIKFSQLGRWIRGALGYGLREASCTGLCGYEVLESSEKSCEQPSCAYARGFLALGTTEGSPAPYRLSPSSLDHPEDPGRWFRLTLFGALSEDHLYWLWGVQRAARKGLGRLGHGLLDTAIDHVNAQELWALSGSTFPVLPQVKTLNELIPLQPKTGLYERLTVTFSTPLETKSAFTTQGEQSERSSVPSLYDLILLIVRRLEALCETYLWPIEPTLRYAPLSRSVMRALTEGSRVYRSACRIERGKRGILTVIGPITYDLPSRPDQRSLIIQLVRAGAYVGVGRGVVEGRGAIDTTVS